MIYIRIHSWGGLHTLGCDCQSITCVTIVTFINKLAFIWSKKISQLYLNWFRWKPIFIQSVVMWRWRFNAIQHIQVQFKWKKGLLKHTYIYSNDTSSFCTILKRVTLHAVSPDPKGLIYPCSRIAYKTHLCFCVTVVIICSFDEYFIHTCVMAPTSQYKHTVAKSMCSYVLIIVVQCDLISYILPCSLQFMWTKIQFFFQMLAYAIKHQQVVWFEYVWIKREFISFCLGQYLYSH